MTLTKTHKIIIGVVAIAAIVGAVIYFKKKKSASVDMPKKTKSLVDEAEDLLKEDEKLEKNAKDNLNAGKNIVKSNPIQTKERFPNKNTAPTKGMPLKR